MTWQWLGHAQHFISADRCRFHLGTVVAAGRFVVSTVGDYYPSEKTKKAVELGYRRTFETMVFRLAPGKFHDCGCPEIGDLIELDCVGYDNAADAQAGHVTACERGEKET